MAVSGGDILGAASQGASLIPALVGRGQNTRTATGFGPGSEGYDPNAGFFGGSEEGLQNYQSRLAGQRNRIDNRAALQANYGQANNFQNMSLDARGGQQNVANMMLARASGQVPSIADMQAQRDMSRLNSATSSAAASARGPGAVAMAQQNAMGARARGTADISNQAQINAAQERERAEGNAFGAYSGMRSGDQGSQQLAAQQAQYQAEMLQRNREANDRRAMGYEQLDYGAQRDAMTGRLQQQQILSQGANSAEQANQQTANQNAQGKGLIDTVGDFAKSIFSDVRAKYMLSDFDGKIGLMPSAEAAMSRARSVSGGNWESGGGFGGSDGGMNPMSGPAGESFAGQAGMLGGSPTGELQAHSDFATQYAGDPTGGMLSDEHAKMAAFKDGMNSAQRFSETGQFVVPPYAAKEAGPKASIEGGRQARQPNTPAPSPRRALVIDHAPEVAKGPYDTRLSPAEEKQFQVWKKQYAPEDSGADYDLRGAFKEGLKPDPKTGHWVDTYKKPNHETFSNESKYATGDNAAKAGHWEGETYWTPPYNPTPAPATGAITSDERTKEKARAQGRAEGMALAGKPRLGPAAAATKTEYADPSKGQAQFVPGRGWVQAGDDERAARAASFDEALSSQAAQDTNDVERDRQAAEGNELRRNEGNAAAMGDTRRGFANDAEAAKIRKGFEEDPTGQAGQTPSWLTSLGSLSKNLNEAQFGRPMTSDERAKTLGPSHSPLADAARVMKGQPYAYKPEFTPPEQQPGEVNYGFMAQNLEKNPITATTVKEGPDGMKRVDAQKLLKVLASTVSEQQEQIDDTRMALSGKRRKAA